MPFVYFFGCNGRPGHYLIGPRGESVDRYKADRLMIPRDTNLDGTFIFLPRPENDGSGALTYLPGTDRTVLAWWGSPFDRRGAVNNAIICDGRLTAPECWSRFAVEFSNLAAQLSMPEVVRS